MREEAAMLVRTPTQMCIAGAALALSPGLATAQKGPSVAEVLQAARSYLMQYAERLGAVAADEEYVQYDSSTGRTGTPVRLSTQVVWLGLADGAVESYRDAVAIDSRPVRTKEERLLGLFTTPTVTSRVDARRMTEDAVQHYIDGHLHALDEAMLAMEFLRSENQHRSTFTLESVKNAGGSPVAVVKFTETGTERLIPTAENAPAFGRFWIDTASGAVRQTEIGLGGRTFSLRATVKYASNTATLWLPVEMSQSCQISGLGSSPVNHMGANGGYQGRQDLDSRATYSNYRQVPVDLAKLR